MIQDIAPKKFYNQFAAKKPSANSRILSFSDGKILYKEKDGEMEFLTFKQVEPHFMQESEKRGVRAFTLEVRVSNTAAIRLYESCGFQIEGTRKGFYDKPKEDAYIMWKR